MTEFELFDEIKRRRMVEGEPLSSRKYLEKNRRKYPWADTILEYGKDFGTPSEDHAHLMYDYFKGMPKGQCFKNSLHMGMIAAEEQKDFSYVEGFIIPPESGGLVHAWNGLPDGRIIDTTWNLFSLFVDYMGIEFPIPFIHDLFTDCGKQKEIKRGNILGHWEFYRNPVIEYLRARS